MYEYCKGCFYNNIANLSQRRVCDFRKYNKSGECPCSFCLIKVMCSNTIGECDVYDEWDLKVRDEVVEERRNSNE